MFANVDFTYSNLLLWGGLWIVTLFITAAFFSVVVHKVLDSKNPGKAWRVAVPGALLTLGVAAGGVVYYVNSLVGFIASNVVDNFATLLLIIIHVVLAITTLGLTFSALRFFLIPSLKKDSKKQLSTTVDKAPPVKTPALNKPVAKTDAEMDAAVEAELKAMGF